VFGRLCPATFAAVFRSWAQVALPTLAGEPMGLDGKTLRGRRNGEVAVHLVSASAAVSFVLRSTTITDFNCSSVNLPHSAIALGRETGEESLAG
jgi:hypothetical protein